LEIAAESMGPSVQISSSQRLQRSELFTINMAHNIPWQSSGVYGDCILERAFSICLYFGGIQFYSNIDYSIRPTLKENLKPNIIHSSTNGF